MPPKPLLLCLCLCLLLLWYTSLFYPTDHLSPNFVLGLLLSNFNHTALDVLNFIHSLCKIDHIELSGPVFDLLYVLLDHGDSLLANLVPKVLDLGLEQPGFAWLYLDSSSRMCQENRHQMSVMGPRFSTVGQDVV